MRQDIRSGPPVATMGSPVLHRPKLMLEAVMFGVAYGSILCWATTCIVASFRVANLAMPYWSAIRCLRTDTCGAAAFVAAAACLAVSEYLRLSRLQGSSAELAVRATRPALAALAVSKTVAVLSTGLVAYLSINAITHPVTLGMSATHFAPWPTEGTLRVLGLGACMAAVGTLRYLSVRNGISRSHAQHSG
jgi:hypothetical protein